MNIKYHFWDDEPVVVESDCLSVVPSEMKFNGHTYYLKSLDREMALDGKITLHYNLFRIPKTEPTMYEHGVNIQNN